MQHRKPKKITHYELLGVKNDADATEIKKAYFNISKIWHSDKTPYWAPEEEQDNANEIFKRIQDAYDILSDPSKRRAYDSSLKQPSRETADDERFVASWERLNDIYKKLKTPDAYIDELKLQNNEMQCTIQQQALKIEQLRAKIERLREKELAQSYQSH